MKTDSMELKFLGKTLKFRTFDKDVLDVKRMLEIKASRAEHDRREIPSLLQAVGMVQARALKNFKMAETNYKIWRAKKGKALKSMTIKGKSLTEKQREDLIVSSSEYRTMKKKLHSAEEKYEIIRSFYWAIQAKADVLSEMSKQRGTLNRRTNEKVEDYEEEEKELENFKNKHAEDDDTPF